MSRIGKNPVSVPAGVEVKVDGKDIAVKGSKGQLSITAVDEVTVELNDNQVVVTPAGETKRHRSMWGMQRTLIANMITGVTEGFKKDLEINGVGYRAQVQGNVLKLALGFSHDIDYAIPEGIDIKCAKPTEISISGIDKQLVGQVAAEIRAYRGPEPYKGKGVKYAGEYIFRKEGKKK